MCKKPTKIVFENISVKWFNCRIKEPKWKIYIKKIGKQIQNWIFKENKVKTIYVYVIEGNSKCRSDDWFID